MTIVTNLCAIFNNGLVKFYVVPILDLFKPSQEHYEVGSGFACPVYRYWQPRHGAEQRLIPRVHTWQIPPWARARIARVKAICEWYQNKRKSSGAY